MKRRFHPLPEHASEAVAQVIGTAVGGAVKCAMDAHGAHLPARWRGMMLGSIRKRAINSLCSERGMTSLLAAMGEIRGPIPSGDK